MTDLTEAIDNLTAPVIEHYAQTDDAGKYLRTHTVEHPPLLQQLADAVRGSFGSDGGAGTPSPGGERNMLDSDALFEFLKITTQVADWCRIRKVAVTRDPLTDMAAWHAARTGEDEAGDTFYIRQLTKWAEIIEGKLNPKKRLEITACCPVCGSDKWVDAEGVAYRFPILVEYRGNGDAVADEQALCRACENVWSGQRALRQLRWDIDEREAG
jgi:hypothetical protein